MSLLDRMKNKPAQAQDGESLMPLPLDDGPSSTHLGERTMRIPSGGSTMAAHLDSPNTMPRR
jgi:hypothetical protein